jgi:hypothetical protein
MGMHNKTTASKFSMVVQREQRQLVQRSTDAERLDGRSKPEHVPLATDEGLAIDVSTLTPLAQQNGFDALLQMVCLVVGEQTACLDLFQAAHELDAQLGTAQQPAVPVRNKMHVDQPLGASRSGT